MIEYRLRVYGGEAVIARFERTPGKVEEAASSSLDAWAKETASYVIASKMSSPGPNTLGRRSGRASRSVHGELRGGGTKISGIIGAGAGVPYFRIHEFGGLIPAHEVVATNAKALRIPLASGDVIFRKSAKIPDVTMPERAPLRTGYREKLPDGIQQLKDATLAAMLA